MKARKGKQAEKSLSREILLTLAGYVKTQFLVFTIVTASVFFILTALGVRYALLLAVTTGALSAVPVFGMTVAAVLTALVAVFDGARFLSGPHPVFEGVIILIIYFLMNQLIDFILAPYLMGRITRINPLLVLFTVIIGTWVFGIMGAVFSVPALLTVRTILKHYEKG
jgi:predicted PurR-regulated permease PerM